MSVASHQSVFGLSPAAPPWSAGLIVCFLLTSNWLAVCGSCSALLCSALGRHGLAGWRATSVLRVTKYSSLHQEEDKPERGRGVNIEYPHAIRDSGSAGEF